LSSEQIITFFKQKEPSTKEIREKEQRNPKGGKGKGVGKGHSNKMDESICAKCKKEFVYQMDCWV